VCEGLIATSAAEHQQAAGKMQQETYQGCISHNATIMSGPGHSVCTMMSGAETESVQVVHRPDLNSMLHPVDTITNTIAVPLMGRVIAGG